MEPVQWLCGRQFSVVLRLEFFSPWGFSLFPACRDLSPLFAEEGCRFPSIHALHPANMELVQWFCGQLFLGGSVVGNFFQPAGTSHPCLLKKVAGFLRSMLCTLQTWNLLSGSADDYFSVALRLALFPHWFYFYFSSLQESLTPAR